MVVVSTPGTLSLIFVNKEDLRNTVENLSRCLEIDEPEGEVKVYSVSDQSYPEDKLREIGYFLKYRFSNNTKLEKKDNEGTENSIQP